MKKILKLYKYIFIYIVIIFIPFIIEFLLKSGSFYFYSDIDIISNPFIFILLDFILLNIILRKVEMEEYKNQKKIMRYFNYINNLYIFIIILLTGGIGIAIVDLGINMLITYMNRPLSPDPSVINGVEEYFNKYPEKKHKTVYASKEEVKKDYKKLKNEIEEELPVLDKEVKEQKKEKVLTFSSKLIFIVPVLLILVGLFFNTVEIMKTYSRGYFHDYEVTINNQNLNILTNQNYDKVVIPFIYRQREKFILYNNNKNSMKTNIDKSEKYILNIKDNICINNQKDRVPCNTDNNLYEYKEETKIKVTNLVIENKYNSYDGKYIKDITKYIEEGQNKIIIYTESKDDNITGLIELVINIK